MPKKDKTKYKVDDKGEGGHKINKIIGSSPFFIVFFGEKNNLRWEIDDDYRPAHFSDCIDHFDKYQSMIINSLSSRIKFLSLSNKQYRLQESLGRALFSAVLSKNKKEAEDKFNAVKPRIENEIQLQARIKYVASSITISILICLLFYLLYYFAQIGNLFPYWMGASAGAVGAGVSVLLRSKNIETSLYTSPLKHIFQGFARTLLGLLSGLILIILINANLILGVVADNLPSIAAFGIISGFSERYLPNILENIQKNTSP